MVSILYFSGSSVAGILRTHRRQTRSDKLGDLINTTSMFLDIKNKTSSRLPSRFEAMNKFCVAIRPDFPVQCLTLKEHLHILQQSFAPLQFTLFFAAFFGVSAPSMKKFDHPSRKSPRAMLCHVCLHFAAFLLDSYLTHVKCRHETSRGAELKTP